MDNKNLNIMLKKVFKKEDERPVVTSLQVDEIFDKKHFHILDDIRKLLESQPKFGESNFRFANYKDKSKHKRPMYYITKDGFTLLTMGYTGKKAMDFKVKYINAFNAMEEELRCQYAEIQRQIEREVKKQLEWQLQREKSKDTHIGLQNNIDKKHNNLDYMGRHYVNAICEPLFGMDAIKIREKLKLDKGFNLRQVFNEPTLKLISKYENIMSILLETEHEYEEIKNSMSNIIKERRDVLKCLNGKYGKKLNVVELV